MFSHRSPVLIVLAAMAGHVDEVVHTTAELAPPAEASSQAGKRQNAR